MAFESLGSSAVSWAGKRADAIGELGDEDGSVLVVPVGSVEQHGDHLPVATDTILVDAVATRGAERVGDDLPVLVTPPIWSGFSPHHLPFGGTLTLDFETMLHVVEDVADSALENGFDALLLLNGHGGNAPLIGAATSTVGTDHPDAEVLALSYFSLAAGFVDELRDSEPGGMSHGGEFETSLLLHLRPDLVDRERGEAPLLDEPYEHGVTDLMDGGSLSVYRSFDEYTDTGAIGAPELASAEKGAALFDRLVDEVAALLSEIHDRNRE